MPAVEHGDDHRVVPRTLPARRMSSRAHPLPPAKISVTNVVQMNINHHYHHHHHKKLAPTNPHNSALPIAAASMRRRRVRVQRQCSACTTQCLGEGMARSRKEKLGCCRTGLGRLRPARHGSVHEPQGKGGVLATQAVGRTRRRQWDTLGSGSVLAAMAVERQGKALS